MSFDIYNDRSDWEYVCVLMRPLEQMNQWYNQNIMTLNINMI